MRHTKGIYSLVTTFFFIMVVLFTVIAFIYSASMIKAKQADINDEMAKYGYIMDAKARLLSNACHGQTIRTSPSDTLTADETCAFPPGVIKGYVIEVLNSSNCTKKSYEHMFSDETGEIFVYFVPVQIEPSLVCPGRLKVVY